MELDLALEKLAELNCLERKVQALQVNLTLAGEGDLEADLESRSPVMQALLRQARQAAASDARILLLRENGTGKGDVARDIHQWSSRRGRPFLVGPAPPFPGGLLGGRPC